MMQRTQAVLPWRVRGLAVLGTLVASLLTVPPPRVAADLEVSNYNSGLCLDVAGASTADGATVLQWRCHGGLHQRWTLAGITNLGFQIIATHSNKCLDV